MEETALSSLLAQEDLPPLAQDGECLANCTDSVKKLQNSMFSTDRAIECNLPIKP